VRRDLPARRKEPLSVIGQLALKLSSLSEEDLQLVAEIVRPASSGCSFLTL